MEENKSIGKAINRIDGLLKVTGQATYATDYPAKNLAYAVIFKSTIAAGKINAINTGELQKMPGVLAVITHENAPKLNVRGGLRGGALLQGPEVYFYGQHIGMVVAETFEQATYVAKMAKVDYTTAEANTDFEKLMPQAGLPKGRELADHKRGNAKAAFDQAPVQFAGTYHTPIEHHHPMEPHSTVAVWEGEKLTLYNGSQIINGAQTSAAATLNLKPEQVHIVSPFIGGGFGSKGGQWANLVLAAVAAKAAGRPVKLALTRQQMFNSVGLRQQNYQKISIGATRDGKMTSLSHEITTHTAINDEYIEGCGEGAKIMYDVPDLLVSYRVVPMNLILPTYTRGPGHSTGSFALESAIDELAHQLNMDPITLRLKNQPEKDPDNGKPWSTRATIRCLQEGAKAFGWDKRRQQPRSYQVGDELIGYGVACGTYPARQRPSSASLQLTRSGNAVKAIVSIAASDLGTGTFTILAQTAADGLGMKVQDITVKLGDSDLPAAAGSVGSVGAASFANAVNEACEKITDELLAKSGKQFFVRPTAYQLMQSEQISNFETRADAKAPAQANEYSSHSFNANFAEVRVNSLTGMVKVSRFLAVTGAGKILNPKTARSQIIGGNVWGIGMALTEESLIDPRWGNFATRSLADYHVPVNMDIGKMDALFVTEADGVVNKMGIKGIGEVGITGVAASIANAIFNATGKRVRDVPITPDKLL
ncbi:xanthine dehydrogenase family protein molybdopterin-binding subunit [Mucilaginibacter calamicampi]|uniref:Xanthine dehydrogenase family protein molybdopterin-binding subunit n=1 Tax=Mucilaginibacter calamicampi TaxID=1302352 RepID=A0ABW2YTW3_9SPHI